MLGLFTVADTFILVVYGEKWSQVIPILKVFCIVGMVQSIVATTGWIFLSLGKADIQLRWGLISGSIALVSIITGVAIGTIMAVTVCYAIANVLLLYHNFTIPGKLIGLRFVEIVQTLRRLLLLSVIMAVVVWMCGGLVPTASGNVFKLIVQIVIGISTYGVLVFFYDNSTYRQLVDLMKNRGSVDGYP
jgi:PST family polysaccharide transporter